MEPTNPPFLQPDNFIAPEGLYSLSPSHFLPSLIPAPITSGTQPALPVRLSFTTVWYPGEKKATPGGLGSLLGMGGKDAASAKEKEAVGGGGYEPSLSSSSEDPTAATSDASGGAGTSPNNPTLNYPPSQTSPQPPASLNLATSLSSAGLTTASASSTTASTSRNFLHSSTTTANASSGNAPHPRPKNNIKTTSSTFVTRTQYAEGLHKLLGERNKAGEEVKWGCWNYGRVFGWIEVNGKSKEPLARITFANALTCHAIQHLTSSPTSLDILIGFVTGDIVWFDPLLGRYSRLNKQGCIHPSPVLAITPHPTNPVIFYATHQDGHIFTYSLSHEDPPSSSSTNNALPAAWSVPSPPSSSPNLGLIPNHHSSTTDEDGNPLNPLLAPMKTWHVPPPPSAADGKQATKHANKNPLSVYVVPLPPSSSGPVRTRSTSTTTGGTGEKGGSGSGAGAREEKHNAAMIAAASAGEIGRGLTCVRVSPDGRMMALAGDEGGLRIVDLTAHQYTDLYSSYFGGLTSLAFSPDSRFLLFAGQDDLITILSPRDQRIVARCQGHSSFVSHVAWDADHCDPGKGRYRFGSVGEDGKILLWDFSPSSLHRPRHHGSSIHHRNSTTSFSHFGRRPSLSQSAFDLPLFTPGGEDFGPRYHPAPSRAEVALLQAVMTKTIDPATLSEIHFVGDAICTVSRHGFVRFWARPVLKARRRVESPTAATGGRRTLVGGAR